MATAIQRSRTPFAARPLAVEISRIFRPGAAASAMLAVPLAFAAPQGGTVTAGQAAIQQSGATTTITQGSQRAAIDWRSFNVGSSETVNFVQPNASSAILNRVVGNEASAIFGRVNANGQVFLVNTNGILFGRSAQVDVGALTASTANISNSNFMAGKLDFNQPGKAGARVENQGSITVGEGGFAALVGRNVANSGVINARLGKVALAAGDAFVLDLYGDKLVNLIVDPAAMNTLTDASGTPLAAIVDQSGQINAQGGRVQLSAATVKQLVDNIINVSGVVRATSFATAPGLISLQGDANTKVSVSGTLETSGDVGGRIEVTGRDVRLAPTALLAAAGGAGSIAIGGDWQGQGPLAHAQQVNIEAGAVIDASAGSVGDGGIVAVWSDRSTQFAGRIKASGGTASGNGGQVEVSSKGQLGFMGDVDMFATHGKQGSLLLDPTNLTIGTVTSGDSEIAADQLRYFLTRGGNVTLTADQNITVDSEVNGLVTGGTGVAGGGLTLTAGNNLTVNQTIALNDGALALTATNGTLSTTGTALLYTGTGNATLRGGGGLDVGQVLAGGAVDIRSASGTVNVRNAIVAASANGTAAPVASLNVDGAGNVSLNGALVQGNATVRSGAGNVGLSTAVIQSVGGNVDVDAGGSITTAANNVGVLSAGTVDLTAGQSIDVGAVISIGTSALTSTGGGVTVHQAITGGGTAATGGLTVNAAGPVALAGVNAGAGGIAITTSSGNITSRGATAAEGGLLSAGGMTLQANAGQAGTTAAPLNLQATAGNVLVGGNTGVNASTLLGQGSITLSAAAGGVTVSKPIAANTGAVNASTIARPTTIAITARDAIDLAGGIAGTGGISVDSSAGSVTLRDSSLFSQGPVTIGAGGAVSLLAGAGIATTTNTGSVSLTSRGGTLTIGNGGIRADGDVNLSLTSQGALTVNSDIQTHAGTIALDSTQGTVNVLASSTGIDAAQNATLDAGANGTNSVITVHAAGDVNLGEMIAYNRVQLTSDTGNVVLKRGLGGNASGSFGGNTVLLNTGYVDYARGYLAQYRPNVGRMVINALQGSVELNGLNLDGNANPTDTAPGLSVTAGRRIVSNNEIAVNKGDIELTGGNTQATDGVYLGSSVYSRGWDSVGADGVRGGTDDQKTGYGIRIGGKVLGLFDNTVEMAQLPVETYRLAWYEAGPGAPPPLHDVRTDALGFIVDAAGLRVRNPDGSYQQAGMLQGTFDPNDNPQLASALAIYNVTAAGVVAPGNANAGTQVVGVAGQPNPSVLQEIAKIEVANNVANFQDAANAGTLVAATTGTPASRLVQIGTTTIAGVGNHTPQTAMRLTDPLPTLVAPSQAAIVSAPTDAGVVGATQGIGLKVLGFLETGDLSSFIWSSTLQMIAPDATPFFSRDDAVSGLQVSAKAFPATVPANGVFTVTVPVLATRTYVDVGGTQTQAIASSAAGQVTITFQLVAGTTDKATITAISPVTLNLAALPATPPAGASSAGAWTVADWQPVGAIADVRLVTPALSVAGSANGVRVSASVYPAATGSGSSAPVMTGATLAPTYSLLDPGFAQPVPFQPIDRLDLDAPRVYNVAGSLADSQASGSRPGTRVFVYDGIIDSASGQRHFDSNTGVAIPGLGGIPGFNNSTVGFAGVGAGFGSLAAGTAGSTGAGSASGQGAGGATAPAGQTGSGTPPPPEPTTPTDSIPVLPVAGADGTPGGGLGEGEVLFGVRAASQADLGRGSAVPGSAFNVFKRRYRLGTSSTSAVCAPESLQPVKPADGKTERDCAAAK